MKKTAGRQGFTLIEIMIVAALIALLSGIAIFSINEFYNGQIRKATIAETHQIATALSFAQQDLQFYPRFNYVNLSRSSILFDQYTGKPEPNHVVGTLDYWGFIAGGQPPQLARVQAGWAGPYLGASSTRNRANRGKGGVVKMRLPDLNVEGLASGGFPPPDDPSVVDWPADPYGNPYVLYQMKTGLDGQGNLLASFITRETEEADVLNAVVSYGRNGYPGGNSETPEAYANQYLRPGALYIPGDFAAGPAQFTLKTCRTDGGIPPSLQLVNSSVVHQAVVDSMNVPNYNLKTGQVGMLDPGSDDIVFIF